MGKLVDPNDRIIELEQENNRLKFENKRLEKHIIWYAGTLAEAHVQLKEEVNSFFWLEVHFDMLYELIREEYGERKAQEMVRTARERKNALQSGAKTAAQPPSTETKEPLKFYC